MTKKEKIVAVSFVLMFILLLTSCIYTICINRPAGYVFNVERWINKIF